MSKIMPQEIEIWYLIPALRKEFAKIFIKNYNLTQKQSAKVLGITEAAISQYLNLKRASQIIFSKKELNEIKKSADEIMKNPEELTKNLYNLCIQFRESKVICQLHKDHDKSISKNCDICFQNKTNSA